VPPTAITTPRRAIESTWPAPAATAPARDASVCSCPRKSCPYSLRDPPGRSRMPVLGRAVDPVESSESTETFPTRAYTRGSPAIGIATHTLPHRSPARAGQERDQPCTLRLDFRVNLLRSIPARYTPSRSPPQPRSNP
jgi:hypothetical protein